MTKTCQVCGAEFEVCVPAAGRAKFCPDCRKAAKKEYQRRYSKRKKAEEKSADQRHAAEQSAHELSQIAREARAEGLSYGMYVAMKEKKKAMKETTISGDKPAPAFTAPEVAQECISPRELDTLRALIGQAVRAFAGIECATPADSYNLGQTLGLLTAAQMILEGDES